MGWGILILRLVVGLTMAAHGAQKMFAWFGGPGFAGMSSAIQSMGFRRGKLYTVLISVAELGGGLFIAAGFLTPLGAAAVIGVMFAAIAIVHWNNGFFNTKGGYEFNLLLMAASVAIVVSGPGPFAVDSLLGWRLSGIGWALMSLAAGAVAAAGVLASRRGPGSGSTEESESSTPERNDVAA